MGLQYSKSDPNTLGLVQSRTWAILGRFLGVLYFVWELFVEAQRGCSRLLTPMTDARETGL